jgi:hypothetical protein
MSALLHLAQFPHGINHAADLMLEEVDDLVNSLRVASVAAWSPCGPFFASSFLLGPWSVVGEPAFCSL